MSTKTVRIYDTALETIQRVIDGSTTIENAESRHYYFEGLKVAKQIIENIQDMDYKEYAYEKFEEVLQSYLDHTISPLDEDDIREIVDSNIGYIEVNE